MGIISILMGIITFFLFTGIGAILANLLVEYKATVAMAVTSLQTVSDTWLIVCVVGLFAFIGLLIGLSLVLHGLTYNKTSKVLSEIKRRM